MGINIRRGLIRLWIVLAVLWVIMIGTLSFSTLRDEFAKAASMRKIDALGFKPDIPVDCSLARGEIGTDYRRDDKDGKCWYELDKFRKLYTEYKDLNDNDLSDRLYERAGIPLIPIRPWSVLGEKAGLAFGAPLAVLVIARALVWVFAGFVKTDDARETGKTAAE